MKVNFEIITPDMAQKLLDTRADNRRLQPSTVTLYARDMREDRWMPNGATIVIDAEGKLIDGQHRMASVVVAQKPVQFLVVRNIDTEAFSTIDTGKVRSTADVMTINHVPNANNVAAAARMALTYISYPNAQMIRGNNTKAEIIRFALDHPSLVPMTQRVARASKVGKLLSVSGMAAILFLADCEDKFTDEIDEFLSGLGSGDMLAHGDPRLTLREWGMGRLTRKSPPGYIHGAIIRGWNAFATGRTLLGITKIDQVTRNEMPIVGFNRSAFKSIPDRDVLAIEQRRENITRNLVAVA